MKKISFIGCGNMASAIINGALGAGFLTAEDICVFDIDSGKTDPMKEKGVAVSKSAQAAAECSKYVLLAVKPQVFPAVLPEIKNSLKNTGAVLISIGAGKTTEYIGSFLCEDTPIIRVMPNINARVGAAMSAVCSNGKASAEQIGFVLSLCKSFGEAMELSEDKFPLFGVIAGCSPAYSFMYIDALARAAVKNGMSKADAVKIAAQSVLGSAKTVLESGSHPWELVDSVCSPGGTTIEGVVSLEKDGFPSAVESAVEASLEKDKKL